MSADPSKSAMRGRARGRSRGNEEQERVMGRGGGLGGPPAPAVDPRQRSPGRHLAPRMVAMSLGSPPRPKVPPKGSRDLAAAFDHVYTRPEQLGTKEGSSGNQVDLYVNYFKTRKPQGWVLFHYDIAFSPNGDELTTGAKKRLVRIAAANLGTFVCDGNSIFTSNRLSANMSEVIEFTAMHHDTPTQLRIRFVAQVIPGDAVYLQVYNSIVRKCLQLMDLTLLGRNFFDQTDAVDFTRHDIQVWPGFSTTLRTHDAGTIYCVLNTHKVIRLDNVFEFLRTIRSEERGNMDRTKARAKNELTGTIVMTTYDRKTYAIHDINFSETPQSTFQKRDGTHMSYLDYYRQKKKTRDRREGEDEYIRLVPELCQCTGLTDSMRANFTLMRDLSTILFQPPQGKLNSITGFVGCLRANARVTEELTTGWGIEIAPNPMTVPGRVLGNELVSFHDQKNQKHHFESQRADFTLALRKMRMVSSVELKNWIIVIPVSIRPSEDDHSDGPKVHLVSTLGSIR